MSELNANQRLRRELAAVYRFSALHGWMDMTFNHISVRLPGETGKPDTYLINPEGLLSEEMTPGALIEVDVEGNIIDQPHASFIPAGFVIHSAIHNARDDAACIMHNHAMAGMVVSALKEDLLPLTQRSMEFYGKVAYHDFGGIELDMSVSDRIVQDLGEHKAMIMRNHGLLTIGRTPAEAYYHMYYLIQSCEIHVNTMKVTDDPRLCSEEVLQHTTKQFVQYHDHDVELVWNAMLRKLDREQPGWDKG